MNMKWMLGICVLGLSLPVIADQDFNPYLGIDQKWNKLLFKPMAGDNALQKNYPQANLFAGIKFRECVALEIGYEAGKQRSKLTSVAEGDTLLGFFNDIFPLFATTKTKISSFNINVLGFYPIAEEYCLSLFGSLGLARLTLKSHLDFSFLGDTEVHTADFSKRKVVPRVSLGLQYMLPCNIGLRSMIGWENTSAFKRINENTRYPAVFYMIPKDKISVGFGVFYRF